MQKLALSLTMLAFGGLVGVTSQAETPPSLTTAPSTMPSRSLGGLCYTLDSGDGLPCNPSHITRPTEKNYALKVFGSNNISYLDDVKRLIDNDIDSDGIDHLFSQTRDSKMELSSELSYRSENFGLSITPFQVKYYSFIRNRALPQLTVLAAREQNLRVQFGGKLDAEGSWGVEVRGVNRKFVSQNFSILDAAVEGRESLFALQTQRAVYIEPGVSRTWTDQSWSPTVSLAIANLGFVDKKYDSFRNSPEVHFGGSVSPPVHIGNWQFGIDLGVGSEIRKLSEAVRLGSVYEFGITRLSGSFGANDYAVGFQMRYGYGIGGLIYQSQLIENWLTEDEWVRTLSLQIGVEF